MGTFREQLLILLSTPLYMIIILLEVLFSHLQHRNWYSRKDSITNVYLMLLNGGLDLLFRAVSLAILGYFYQHRIFSVSQVLAYWVMLLVMQDFMYYWLHRVDHEVRFFWAIHVTHHSSEKLNFSVGFRSSVFQPMYRFIYFIPLAWLGFRPLDIAFIYSATQIWGIFVHTEWINKMGWLEYIFVTPSHHRVHHASNAKYLDRNMGMFLIVWDKIFGTFQPELPASEYQPLQYGLTSQLTDHGPANIVFHEWKSIISDLRKKETGWFEKVCYVIGPPGWSHDGSRLTSDQMRARESGESVPLPASTATTSTLIVQPLGDQ